MAITLEDLRRRRQPIVLVVEAHGAANPRVFGSVARGDADEASDVDLLVDFRAPRPRGFAYFGAIADMQREIEALIGRPVHVSEANRQSAVGRQLLDQAVPL